MFHSPLVVVVKVWLVGVEVQGVDERLVSRIGTPCRSEGLGRSVNGDASVTNEASPIRDLTQQQVGGGWVYQMVI